MEKYYEYSFLVTHSYGQFFKHVISYNKRSAVQTLMNSEGCPKRAIEYINRTPVTI